MGPNPSEMPGLENLTPQDASLFVRFGFGRQELSPFHCLHHAFEYQVSQSPDAIAVEHLDETITYSQLDQKANGLARRLRDMGVCPGSRVCLLVERSISMVIGILAVLKAGAAYVPLDGSIVTQSTLEFVLKDSHASVVLALSQYTHRITGYPVITLEEAISALEGPQGKPRDLSSPDDSIYIIYTSGKTSSHFCPHGADASIIGTGTTGTPKGVEVTHRNVTNCAFSSMLFPASG